MISELQSQLVFFIGGIVLILLVLFALSSHFKAKQAVNWPTVKGTVLTSEAIRGGNDQMRWKPHLLYEYKVGSTTYKSFVRELAPNGIDEHLQKEDVEKILAPYKVGESVDVYYNENDPQYACLEPGASGPGVFVMAVVFGLGGLALIIVGLFRAFK